MAGGLLWWLNLMEFKITMETNFWACLWGSFSIRPIEADWFTPTVGGITPWCPGKDCIKTGSSEPSTSALALLALSFLTVDEVWAATSSSVRTSHAHGPSSQTARKGDTSSLKLFIVGYLITEPRGWGASPHCQSNSDPRREMAFRDSQWGRRNFGRDWEDFGFCLFEKI